jgi:hypothetical protein
MELIRLINRHVKCNVILVTNPKSHSMHVYKFSMHVCASFLDLKATHVHVGFRINMNMGSKWKYI